MILRHCAHLEILILRIGIIGNGGMRGEDGELRNWLTTIYYCCEMVEVDEADSINIFWDGPKCPPLETDTMLINW